MTTTIHPVRLGITCCYLIVGERGRCVLVDAGVPGQEARFDRRLERLGIAPRQIELVVLTHGHWDHVGSAAAIRQRTGAPLAMHVLDRHGLELGQPTAPPAITAWGRVLGGALQALRPFRGFTPAAVDIPLGNDDLDLRPYGIAGRVVFTPGHSRGSVSVVLDSGEALVGDMAMNGPPIRLRPGPPIFAEAPGQIRPSWGKLLDLNIHTVYPAHGRAFPAAVMQRVTGG